jgi:poly(3-hydroxybutyrate) depolymerase/glycerophosphoryl diester phosphodiesterase
MQRLVPLALTMALLAGCSGTDSEAASAPSSAAASVDTAPADTTSITTEPPDTTATDGSGTESSRRYAATIDELISLGRPIVLAHTAGEDEFPASTMFAFAESVEAGVDMLDLNINLTADDELLVQHDETVDRNTDGTGAVIDLTAAEAAELDAAYWFSESCADCRDLADDAYLYRGMRTGSTEPPAGYTADDFALPTLRQLVARFPDIPLNIEIKGSGELARRMADVLAVQLEELGKSNNVVVSSFEDDIVEYFRSRAPDVEVSPGLDALTAYVLEGTDPPAGMRILQLPPEYTGVTVITPELVARSTAKGFPIWVWPNNRSLENFASYRDFLEQGIAGLNINFPADGVRAVTEFAAAGTVPVALSAGCTSTPPAASGETVESITAAGMDGTFIRHLPPAYDGVTPLPVVVGLHGWSQPSSVLAAQSALPSLADRYRFVAVVPDITRPVPLWDAAVDSADVAWMDGLLDVVEQTMCVDTNRVHVIGMSNGAMMTSAIGCTLGDRVASVSAVAGLRVPEGCDPEGPVPLVAFHGNDDQFLAFTGGFGVQVSGLPQPDGQGTLGSVQATGPDDVPVVDRAGAWAALNGCTGGLVEATPPASDIELLQTEGCEVPVRLYVVDGGGHTWPGSEFDQQIADLVGPTTTSLDATVVSWLFFRDHPRS